jgi:hypothetical protein
MESNSPQSAFIPCIISFEENFNIPLLILICFLHYCCQKTWQESRIQEEKIHLMLQPLSRHQKIEDIHQCWYYKEKTMPETLMLWGEVLLNKKSFSRWLMTQLEVQNYTSISSVSGVIWDGQTANSFMLDFNEFCRTSLWSISGANSAFIENTMK